MPVADPWSEFRTRWRSYYGGLVLWIASGAMIFSDRLFPIWQWLAVPLFSVFGVLYWRTTQLDCPGCGELFYWPPRVTQWRRCVHCGLKQYASLEPADTSPGRSVPGGA